jgi:hypothetical protein
VPKSVIGINHVLVQTKTWIIEYVKDDFSRGNIRQFYGSLLEYFSAIKTSAKTLLTTDGSTCISEQTTSQLQILDWGTRWRSWLRNCATKRKVAGSVPDAVTGIFPSGRIVALVSTQPLREISILPGSKDGRCVRLTTLPPLCADCLEILEPQPPGTPRARPGL